MRHKNLSKSFAEVLRKHRKQKKITQETLAEKADVSPKMISVIERGVMNPSLNLMDSIAQGLGISLAQMIKEAEKIRAKH
jgi:transcriptional regulator with XRE-family HTH domain